MAKNLKDILTGVRSSKVEAPDLKDLVMSPKGNKATLDFTGDKKYNGIETHDYPHDAEAAFKGLKGGGKQTTKYKFQSAKVYEEVETVDEKYSGFQKTKQALAAKGAKDPAALAAWIGRKKYGKAKFQAAAAAGKKLGEDATCNHTTEGNMCEVHGKAACPTEDDVNTQPKGKKDSKGREYLADKKKWMEEGRIEDDAQRKAAKKLSDIAKSSNVPVTKLKPGKKSYNQIKSTGQMFGGARQFAAGLSKRDIESGDRGSSVGKAKLKEEEISEVAPPNPKIEKWINSNKERFVKEYGKEKGMQVLYAKAWKMHGQSESGGATNTPYTGGTLGSTGRLDVGTLE
jgi:hypothetical protein